jgi:hypothetical protein
VEVFNVLEVRVERVYLQFFEVLENWKRMKKRREEPSTSQRALYPRGGPKQNKFYHSLMISSTILSAKTFSIDERLDDDIAK